MTDEYSTNTLLVEYSPGRPSGPLMQRLMSALSHVIGNTQHLNQIRVLELQVHQGMTSHTLLNNKLNNWYCSLCESNKSLRDW